MAVDQTTQIITYRDWLDPSEKNKDWILTAVRNLYTYGGAKNMLHGKKVQQIFSYAEGNHSMAKFLAMFPEGKKKSKKVKDLRRAPRPGEFTPSEEELNNHSDLLMDRETAISLGMDLEPLGILQQPIASAISTLQKGMHQISFTAEDAMSNSNRKMDLDRLKNRPAFEAAISPAKQFLGMPLQSPGTQHNVPTVDISTLGLDPSKPDQLNMYADLFYKLRPESAFEVAVAALQDITGYAQKLDIQKRDQIYFGVDTCRSYFSAITDLPDYDYVFPGNVYSPKSDLPDHSDQPFRYIKENYTIEKMLNTVGREAMDAADLQGIFEDSWKVMGYQDWQWDKAPDHRKLTGIPVVYIEFKSFDVLRYERKRAGRAGRMVAKIVPFDYKTDGSKKSDADGVVRSKWPQQTYYAYWVPGTDHILKSGKVEGLFRAKGKENKSPFTILINKSKEKSDVEQCITAVDDAQRAYIKLQLSVIMAKPKGVYIDFKYLRHAATTMAEELALSAHDLLKLFYIKNVMIGDTEDMDGEHDGNFLPFREIPGGMGSEAAEYLAIIGDAIKRIATLTGFNDALTGQSPNPDQLVGIQKLMLQSSLNSLHYAQKAIKRQTEATVQLWAPMIQFICRPENKNTEARKALESIIGAYKIAVIDDMDKLSVGQFGLKVEDAPDTEAQQELKQLLFALLQGQRIEIPDYFLVRRVVNYKDAEGLLIIRERQKKAEDQKMQQQQQAAMLQNTQMQEQGAAQREATKQQGLGAVQQLKSETAQQLEQMKSQIALMLKQIDERLEITKKQMQGDQAREKLYAKHSLGGFNFA